jgi:hypothetical protein
VSRLGFPNYRYRHLDLATKFLYVERRGGLVDLKKRDLDNFVRDFKSRSLAEEAETLFVACTRALTPMRKVFIEEDYLLKSVGMVTVYYYLFRQGIKEGWVSRISRDALVRFDTERLENRRRIKEVQDLAFEGRPRPRTLEVNAVLAAFERYVQSPNDAKALTSRFEVLRRYVLDGVVPSTE